MPVQGYKHVDENDWGALRWVLRSVFERLSKLEGNSGESVRRATLDMNGNRIDGGPAGQATAKEDEFLTKAYFRSPEAGAILATLLRASGGSPLPSFSLPSTVRPRAVVDEAAAPAAPAMAAGELIFFLAPALSRRFLVYFDGKDRFYFEAGGTGGTNLF